MADKKLTNNAITEEDVVMATNKEKSEAIFAVILGVAQAAMLCGVVSGSALQVISGNETLIIAGVSTLIGVIQTYIKPVMRGK